MAISYEPAKEPALKIRVVSPDGNFIPGKVNVTVQHRKLGENVVQRGADASKEIVVPVLRRAPEGEYQVTVTPADISMPQAQFVNVPARGSAELTFVFQSNAGTETPAPPATVVLPDRYFVMGTVAGPNRAAVAGLRVLIMDKGVGPDAMLKVATTDEAGRYAAQFDATMVRQKGKLRPDLQAQVFAGETLLASSSIHYNAAEKEIIDVALPAQSDALPTEHETLRTAIAQHFRGALSELQESEARQDITYLANKTGWDARAVALAVMADRFSNDHKPANGAAIDPAFFYALFRAGLPANGQTLFSADRHTVERVWKEGIEQCVIPKRLERDVPAVVEAYVALSAKNQLAALPAVGTSTMSDMLATSRLTTSQQEQFANLYAQHRSDLTQLWPAVTQAFGPAISDRLQVDGKLGFLTLSNAPLMERIHMAGGERGIDDPVRLAQNGFHRAEMWNRLLTDGVPIPKEIPGDSVADKRRNYADHLAAQVRLSYPTAAVAEMVRSGDFPVERSQEVHAFLTDDKHRDFEIGGQPIEQYVKRNSLQVAPETIREIKRVQRVYQITPSDTAMSAFLSKGFDSALKVVSQPRAVFVEQFRASLGEGVAGLAYDRALDVHNAVFNLALGFVQARRSVPVGKRATAAGNGNPAEARGGGLLPPPPDQPVGDNADDIIAYPTLEKLFGSMDFCACDHCRSVLSPAAYLVDLLLFLDHNPTDGTQNPQSALFARRPDIQHLPLTCENTNTVLPYIDVVNETLEYFIANGVQKLSLKEFVGHDTDGAASADLLASPQYVIDEAYNTLQSARFPAPLPFHKPLENLRAYFDQFETPLTLAMERLRKNDDLERGASPYGWRDVLMEELRLSRDEYEILTDSVAVPLARLYGFGAGTADAAVIDIIANAKKYARRTGISYEDLVAILRTRFVNPSSDLIARLERLGVDLPLIIDLKTKNDAATNAKFDATLPTGAGKVDPKLYGGDIKAWLRDDTNFDRLMKLIVLRPATPTDDPCDFDLLELRHAKPAADASNRVDAVDLTRMLRFIRLWRKTGWTIDQTDAALCALFRDDGGRLQDSDVDALGKLDAGFLALLPRLGVVVRVMRTLSLTAKRDLLPLLACWSDIGTDGNVSLYAQMFLNPTLLAQDAVFAADIHGAYLGGADKLEPHAEAVRSALSLTADEYAEIIDALGFDANTPLTVANVSAVFRRGYLARKLRISVRELRLLIDMAGFHPFSTADFGTPHPDVLHLIELVQALKARGVKTSAALYTIVNEDLSGKSAPDPAAIRELVRTLRGDCAAIESQFAAADGQGDVARARMELVYGSEAADAFFALLDDTLLIDVPYVQVADALDPAIAASDPKISYDPFKHRLAHAGLLTKTKRDDLQALAAATADFTAAVEALFVHSDDAKESFFTKYGELRPLYDAYVASVEPLEMKRAKLLAAFRPELSRRRKRQQALQRLSAAAGRDLVVTTALLDAQAAPYPLHAAGDIARPAIDDVLAVEKPGLGAAIFFADVIGPIPDLTVAAADNFDFAAATNPLPANPVPGAAISGIWSGSIETPEAGFYNVIIETDADSVVVRLGGNGVALTRTGTLWRNTNALELKGGTLYDIEFTVQKVTHALSVKWETPKRPREIIPGRYLYPSTIFPPFTDLYLRFLKATSLAQALRLTTDELAHFAVAADDRVGGDGWLNKLPASGTNAAATTKALVASLESLLDFARIKSEVSPDDDRALRAISTPADAATIMRWEDASLTSLLGRFGAAPGDLAHLATFRRVYDAFALVQAMGISASSLLDATTNAPDANTVKNLQGALRARYEAEDWRNVVQPINDALRAKQRDALVAYILHQFRSNPATEHIDTADKLFEYFLMDVEMEPCMQTSRVRHALSSAQLFIERCLMNLETNVSPASVNAGQWEWMKRYRVWEANRKVFLFPENWLEPELRDDKSPFFKEIESELLQSDITEDSANTALLNYLAKLEEVAKLEPCGICHVDGDARTPDVEHVIARTAGAHRKYYYRRREGLSWTPWEQIKLDVEGNPVLPVVWNDRLLLFWLRITKEGPTASKKPSPGTRTDLIKLTTDDVPADPTVATKAILCYSEYYNNKWQPAKTSDENAPIQLAPTDFPRHALTLSATEIDGGILRIGIDGPEVSNPSFHLYNTHSLPEPDFTAAPAPAKTRFEGWWGSFFLVYGDSSSSSLVRIVTKARPLTVVKTRQPVASPWDAPFFYNDSRHSFFVTTREKRVLLWSYLDFGIVTNVSRVAAAIPPVVVTDPRLELPQQRVWGNGGPIGPDPGVIDVNPVQRFVSEDAFIHTALGTRSSVTFGDRQIGPFGSIAKSGTF
jgi:ABC toxin-like protein/neuraminidase-like protein/virulence plasmid A protein